jgi:hypothetical protein
MPIRDDLPVFERPVDRAAELRGRRGVVRFLDLPRRRAVMIDGDGRPGPEAFAPRLPGLYGTAYRIRFALKTRDVVDKVGPLEGLWWTTSGTTDLDEILGADSRQDWRWTILIVLPEEATDDEVEAGLADGRAKIEPRFAQSLRIETLDEGRVAQVLHVGPYSAERAWIALLHAAIEAAGLHPRERHHEIYLGDARTSAPERLRTILRHPVG